MTPEAVLQVIVTGVVTVLSILGSVVWLDRKIDANQRELKGDMTTQTTELKVDIAAMGEKSEIAHREILGKLDTANEKIGKLEVGQATLTERVKCLDDKLDAVQRRLADKRTWSPSSPA